MLELLSTALLLWGAWGQPNASWGSPDAAPSLLDNARLVAEILTAVCDEDDLLPGGEGCATCPALTFFAGADERFLLQKVYAGSFSSAGLDEFVASFAGCEPGYGLGATVLFGTEPAESGSAALVRTGYFPDINTNDCAALRSYGERPTDELFCEVVIRGQGEIITLLDHHTFKNAELSSHVVASAVDLSDFGCLDPGLLQPSYVVNYTASYTDPYTVSIALTRKAVVRPVQRCEPVTLTKPETLSYSWRYTGAAWVLQPLYDNLSDGVLSLAQYQKAERQLLENDVVDKVLAAYLSGRVDAERFAALF